MTLQPLTHSEEDIMNHIWSKGKIYFRELMDTFPEPKPHQNTVSTFLKILVEKDYLRIEKQGRIHLYLPAIDMNDYKKLVTKKFLDQYFDNSANALMKLLLEENLLQTKDFGQFFEVKTSVVPIAEHPKKKNPIRDFVDEITSDKKHKKKDKKKKKKK